MSADKAVVGLQHGGLFRKKPVVIEAMRWPGIGIDAVDATLAFEEWFLGHGGVGRYIGHDLHIKTLEDGPNGEAKHVADPGDWIIRGVQGEFYPCKPDIFAATYDAADQQAAEPASAPVGIREADEPKAPAYQGAQGEEIAALRAIRDALLEAGGANPGGGMVRFSFWSLDRLTRAFDLAALQHKEGR